MAKIKLSETIHFFPVTEEFPNDSSESTLTLRVDANSLLPGETVHVHIHCAFAADATSHSSTLDYLTVSLEGQIKTSQGPTPFVHAAEIEHGRTIRNNTGFTLAASIRIPSAAIATNSDATWILSARAVWQDIQILHNQTDLTIMNASQHERGRILDA